MNNNELYTEKVRLVSNAIAQLEQALDIDFGPDREFLADDPDLDTILGYLEEYLSSLEQYNW
jgi:acyl-CoA synthetase (NDP forming)